MKLMPGYFYIVDNSVCMFEYESIILDQVYYYFINIDKNIRFVVCDKEKIKEF